MPAYWVARSKINDTGRVQEVHRSGAPHHRQARRQGSRPRAAATKILEGPQKFHASW